MASVKLYLDTRQKKLEPAVYPLKISISVNNGRVMLSTGVKLSPGQWRDGKVVNHPNKSMLNTLLLNRLSAINNILLGMSSELRRMTPAEIKEAITSGLNPCDKDDSVAMFKDVATRFIDTKQDRTRELYQATIKKVTLFCDIDSLRLEDIDYDWLCDFSTFLSSTSSTNSIAIHIRNIRAIYNRARHEKLTTEWPFLEFKIKSEPTMKRSLTLEQLVTLATYPCEAHQERYRDLFLLIFYLRGINMKDLCQARQSDVVNGRLEYRRAKTHRLYSVKIEPEAQEIIDKYPSKFGMLIGIPDAYTNYKDLLHRTNENLSRIGEVSVTGCRKSRKPLFPDLTTYWARHTFATLLHKLDIPKDVISMALGHSFGNRTTDAYIDWDEEKVDKASRLLFDKVTEEIEKKRSL